MRCGCIKSKDTRHESDWQDFTQDCPTFSKVGFECACVFDKCRSLV